MLAELVDQSDGWQLSESAEESEFFKLKIQRLAIRSPDSTDWFNQTRNSPADVIIVRYPSSATRIPALLSRIDRSLICAGTLVYWSAATDLLASGTPSDCCTIRTAVPEEFARIEEAIISIFDGYPNHYSYDPVLGDADVAASYARWTGRLLRAEENLTLLAQTDGNLAGVTLCALSGRDVEVVLAGILPEHRRSGFYGALLASVAKAATTQGQDSNGPGPVDRLVISTQLDNIAVQRAWARLGLQPLTSFETVHLVNPRLLETVVGQVTAAGQVRS